VINDPTTSKNGDYVFDGTSWGSGSVATDSNGWTVRRVSGSLVCTRYVPAQALLTFGAAGGSNWQQSAGSFKPPTGYSWDDFGITVSVYPTSTSNNDTQTLITGRMNTTTGTGTGTLLFQNPSAVSIPNTFMSLQAFVTLVEL
jgi:hypothetical protein